MPFIYLLSMLVVSTLISSEVSAYGSGSGGGSACSEPQFSDQRPKEDSPIQKLERFEIDASKNTDLNSLEFEIDGIKQTPKMTPLRSGDTHLEVTLNEPRTKPSKVRITLRARSIEGCETFKPIYIEIQP